MKSANRPGSSMFIATDCKSSESCGECDTTSRNSSCAFRCKASSSASISPVMNAELEALQRNAQELFRDVVSHSPQLSDDLQSVALNIDDPGRLADFIAGTLPSLSTLVRQELIETPNVRKRLEALIRELSKELEV